MLSEISHYWPILKNPQIAPILGSNINQTFRAACDNGLFILQCVNPIFSPEVHFDIEAVTSYLRTKGLQVPQLIPNREGQLYSLIDGNCWRVMTLVQGQSFHFVSSEQMGYEAGQLVGRFHQAIQDFNYQYRFTRSGVHDTPKHMERLCQTVANNSSHRLANDVIPLAKLVLKRFEELPTVQLPARHSHGDLKISNMLFDDSGKATGLIDLDTFGKMPWPIEMGDAFRSWCNPSAEDVVSEFRLDIFKAALAGYVGQAGSLWSGAELDWLSHGILLIPLELSSRFLMDALLEKYFAHDPSRYATHGDHALARGKAQFKLFQDIEEKLSEIDAIVHRVFRAHHA